MKVKFDSLNRFEVPQMFLCNPGSVYRDDKTLSGVVGMLHNKSDEEIVFNFNATSELHFRVYDVKVDDPDEYAQILKVYTSLQNRRMIFVEDVGFFIITEVIDGASEGKDYKDITASSCESEIEYKNIPYIEDGTYQFVPLLSSLVKVLPLWTIGEIDPQVSEKYRTFEGVAEDKNILSFLMEDMQDAYECIFSFDTINRKINVYDQNNFVVQTPIHLTKDDLINTIEIVENSDDLYTAISVLGDEHLNITAINPLGTNVIYNFDYYLNWMSEGLKSKVISWQELIKEKFGEYYDLNLEYYNILTQQNDAKYEMQKLQTQITMYTRCKENMVASGNTYVVDSYNELIEGEGGTPITIYPEISDTIESIKELIAQAELEYSKYERQYNTYNTQLEALQVSINNIRNQVAIDKYFTQSEYDELYNYIFEGNYSDDYITVTESMTFAQRFEQMKTLYDRAVIQLEKVSKPTQKFSVGLENFLFVKDFEEWSEQLETGCLLNIELNDNDIAALFLSTIAVNYDDKALDFTFGNRFNKYDPKSLFKDALGNIKKSSNSINYIKDIIYPIKDGKFDEVAEAIRNSRNLTKNAVLASKNEEVLIDEHGYTGRSVDDDGGIDPRQIKITGKNIVFTDDAWDTCKIAIGEVIIEDDTTVYGINAETIIGNLIFGNQLQIKNTSGTMSFDAQGFNVTDGITSVAINPSDTSVFKISNNNQGDLLYIGSDGMLNVTGNITAKSLILGTKKFTGSYNDLSDKPTIPDSIELPDNILTTDDVEVTTSGNTKYVKVGNTSYEIIDNDDYILLGTSYSEGSDTSIDSAQSNNNNYFKISTDGLLQANNAVIYGTIYATSGRIKGRLYFGNGNYYIDANNNDSSYYINLPGFKVDDSSGAVFSGKLSAPSGKIGHWNIGTVNWINYSDSLWATADDSSYQYLTFLRNDGRPSDISFGIKRATYKSDGSYTSLDFSDVFYIKNNGEFFVGDKENKYTEISNTGKLTCNDVHATAGQLSVWRFTEDEFSTENSDLTIYKQPSNSSYHPNAWMVMNMSGFGYFGDFEVYNDMKIDFGDLNVYGGNLTVAGTKSRLATTQNYGQRLLYCYETPSPIFGDLGEGQLDDTGKCYVFLDDIFVETIDTDCNYQVFLQPYGKGECYIAERTPSYFIVEGTNNISFGWEIKAIQKNFDTIRLEELIEKESSHDYTSETYDYLTTALNSSESEEM